MHSLAEECNGLVSLVIPPQQRWNAEVCSGGALRETRIVSLLMSDLIQLDDGISCHQIRSCSSAIAGSTAGEIIGLREVLLEANFTRSIRAETNVVLWRISKANLYAVVAQYPDLGLELYSAATRQLTALAEDLQASSCIMP